MAAQSQTLAFGTLQSLDTSGLSGSYLFLGQLSYPARIIKITNNSTVDVTVSTDGTTDMDIVPLGSFVLYDIGTNKGTSAPCTDFANGTSFFVKGSAGTGSVYLTYLYSVPFETLTGL